MMSLTVVIALNAILDLAVILGLAWVMLVPFRLDRPSRETSTVLTNTDDLCRTA